MRELPIIVIITPHTPVQIQRQPSLVESQLRKRAFDHLFLPPFTVHNILDLIPYISLAMRIGVIPDSERGCVSYRFVEYRFARVGIFGAEAMIDVGVYESRALLHAIDGV